MRDILKEIFEYIQNNQILLAGLGLSGAGIITFWLKDVPRSLIRLIQREFTTELVITSNHYVYYQILKWIERKYENKNFRRLKLNNDCYDGKSDTIMSVGYGTHLISFKGVPLLISLNKDSANQTEKDKESMTIYKLGRSRKLFDDMVKDILREANKSGNKIKIFKSGGDYWYYAKDIEKRKIESVFIEKKKMDKLLKYLSDFVEKEQWYLDNGIPYQLGILLYGPPGTGKTSLIRAIASYLDYPVYYISPRNLSWISGLVSNLPDRSLLVIEDIDSNKLTHQRNDENVKEYSVSNTIIVTEEENSSEDVYLSDVLNALDGIFYAHGRILIATTNHIDVLDSALIRPGRIDLKIEVGYVNNEILEQFLRRFYPKSNIDYNKLRVMKIRDGISVADLQNKVLQDASIEDILDYVVERGNLNEYHDCGNLYA